MNRSVLYGKVRARTRELLNGYLDLPQVVTDSGLEEYISPSVWKEGNAGGAGPGLVGALVMAQVAYEGSEEASGEIKAATASPVCKATKSQQQCPMKSLAVYGSIFALGAIVGSIGRRRGR